MYYSYVTLEQTAVPAVVRHMMRYGVMGGLFFGLIGQFAFRYLLEKAILSQPQLGIQYTLSAVAMAVIVLAAALGILITILGSRWRAPSEISRLITGMAVGFGFALATHTMFVGALTGLLSSRDSIIFLYADFAYNSDDRISVLLDTIFRVFFEGYGMAFTIIFVLMLLGALFGSWLIPLAAKERETALLKDAFGSLVLILLPSLFVLLVITNAIIYDCLPVAMHAAAKRINHPRLNFPLLTMMAILPMLSIPITQLVAILWVQRARAENLHRPVLRMAQFIHVLTAGVALLPFVNDVSPDFLRTPFGIVMVTLTMILAWLFTLVAQWKMGEFKAKNVTRARVPFWSLMRATWGVVLVGYLLVDLLTARAALNLIYPIMMDDHVRTLYAPMYSNASIATIVSRMLYEGFTDSVFILAWSMLVMGVKVTVVMAPILWFFNLFERS
jgi:hypothetical protein